MRDALRDAFMAGYQAALDHKFHTDDHIIRHFHQWYQRSIETLNRAPLTAVDQRRQGMSCGCQGTDDYCPCQNVRLK